MNEFSEMLRATAAVAMERIVAFLPSILGALLLVIAGWVLARVLRALTSRAVLLIESVFARVNQRPGAPPPRIRGVAVVLGTVVFWGVLLIFATAAAQVLQISSFAEWLGRLIGYLPTLAAGILIIFAGYLLSRFVANLVVATATRLDHRQREMLARISQVVILTAALLVGADQIGVRVTFLAIFAAAIAFVVGGGIALAVGLGARDYVANLIGAHQLRQAFAIGQSIRVSGYQGRILDLTATTVVLEIDEGRVTLPGRVYGEGPVTVLARAPHD